MTMQTQLKREEPQNISITPHETPTQSREITNQTTSLKIALPESTLLHTSARRRRRFWRRTGRFVRVSWWRFVRRERAAVWKVYLCYALGLGLGVCLGWTIHGWDAIIAGLGKLKVDGKSAVHVLGPAFLQICAGLVAGSITLWQFLRSHRQRDEHLARTQRLAQRQAEQKERVDREHFRSKELQDQFGDIQDRLASDSPIIAANAAIRLAQFGKILKVGGKDETKNEDNYPYFIDSVSQLSTALYLEDNMAIRKAIKEGFKNLILFANTRGDGQPLLHTLIERVVESNRTAKVGFIRAFAEWTLVEPVWRKVEMIRDYYENGEGDEPFPLDEQNLIEDEAFDFVAAIAPFCELSSDTRLALKSLMEEGRAIDDNRMLDGLSLFYIHRGIHSESTSEDRLDRLKALELSAHKLIDSRDILARALKALSKPLDFPSASLLKILKGNHNDILAARNEVLVNVEQIKRMFGTYIKKVAISRGGVKQVVPVQVSDSDARWKRNIALDLRWCFLSGTDLQGVNLQGASFSKSYLHSCKLQHAHLEGALLDRSNLQRADLSHAHLISAVLVNSNLHRARMSYCNMVAVDGRGVKMSSTNLHRADLREADLRRSMLLDARLMSVSLQHANLQSSDLRGTRFTNSKMEGVKLYGATIREREDEAENLATEMPSNTLHIANFAPPYLHLRRDSIDRKTEQLQSWLAKQTEEETEEPEAVSPTDKSENGFEIESGTD